MSALNWYVVRLRSYGRLPPPEEKLATEIVKLDEKRIEFDTLYALTQREHPAIVPFEIKRVQKAREVWIDRKYPFFPAYVFVGLSSVHEFLVTRNAINERAEAMGRLPPIVGLVGYGPRPAILSPTEVSLIQRLSNPAPTEINLHRAIQAGGKALVKKGIFSGHVATVSSVDRESAKVLLDLFGSMREAKISLGSLVAA